MKAITWVQTSPNVDLTGISILLETTVRWSGTLVVLYLLCTLIWPWPDPRSRSGSQGFWISENCTFLGLSPPTFWRGAQNWQLIMIAWDLAYSLSEPDFQIASHEAITWVQTLWNVDTKFKWPYFHTAVVVVVVVVSLCTFWRSSCITMQRVKCSWTFCTFLWCRTVSTLIHSVYQVVWVLFRKQGCCCVADKSQGDGDVVSLAEHVHTLRVAEGNSSTDDTEREL